MSQHLRNATEVVRVSREIRNIRGGEDDGRAQRSFTGERDPSQPGTTHLAAQSRVMVRRRMLGLATGVAAVVGAAIAASTLVRDDTGDVRPRETWIVAEGETRTFSPTEILPGDGFRCGGQDGPGVAYVPEPGALVGNSAGITVTTAMDGTVTVECERRGRPPGFTPAPAQTRTLVE